MKNVLILGATSDIAKATAYLYAQKGYSITLTGRQLEKLEPLMSDIKIKHNVPVATAQFDALAYNTHQTFYNELPIKPDVAICVFGYLGEQRDAEKDESEMLKILGTNYTGAASILNVIANDFEDKKQGCIVGISSVAGERGRQSNYFYGSAKAGFSAYLSGLRNRMYKAGVHVVTVKPGFVYTAMTEGMKLPAPITAKPEQVAKSIYKAYKKKKNIVFTLWMWKYIMALITSIPEFMFKKMKL